jgi:hypothetical protein
LLLQYLVLLVLKKSSHFKPVGNFKKGTVEIAASSNGLKTTMATIAIE